MYIPSNMKVVEEVFQAKRSTEHRRAAAASARAGTTHQLAFTYLLNSLTCLLTHRYSGTQKRVRVPIYYH